MRENRIDVFGVEFGKEIVEQENGFFFGRAFDKIDKEKFESDKNGFIFSSGEIDTGRNSIPYYALKIIEMRTDISVSGNDIPLPVSSQIGQYARFDVFEINLRSVYEREMVLLFQERFDGGEVFSDEINTLPPIEIIGFRPFDEERVPEIEGILAVESFSDSLQETVPILESESVFPSDLGELGIGKNRGFIEKIPSESRSEIEDIHLHRSKKNGTKRHIFHIAQPGNYILLREEMHFSFPLGMTDPSGVRKMVFGKCSSHGKSFKIGWNQLEKTAIRRRNGVDEKIYRLKNICLSRTVRPGKDIFPTPRKRPIRMIFERVESERGKHKI